MHISRGLGVPTLAFFGSTAPEQFHFEGHALLFSNEPCAPCHFYGRKACPKKHFNCLMNISADQAWEALQPLLDGERRGYLRG
jgi:ADP-heptose:LPS heptosyltransferase